MDDIEFAAFLNEKAMFLPVDHVKNWISFILYSILVLSFLYIGSFQTLKRMSLFDAKEPYQMREISFMIAANLKNLVLMSLGMYHFMLTLPAFSDTTMEERITKFESMSVFGATQIAYNMFSLPLSLALGETWDVMIHHIAVVVMACVSTFFTCGGRYHAPFFFGVVEISNTMFGIVKLFKTIPEWIQKYPTTYSAVRIAFAIPFLTVRVLMWLPQVSDVVSMHWLVFRTCESMFLRIMVGFSLTSLIALTGLQLYWGVLIIKALIKHSKKKKRADKQV